MTGTGRRVENLKIFAAIVDCFGYRTTRKEWVRALRELQQAGQLTMEGAMSSAGKITGLRFGMGIVTDMMRIFILAILAFALCSCATGANSYEILGLHLKPAADGDYDGFGYVPGEGDPE
jgi:hypothetical protein